jgi:hypothetical protein
MFLVMVMQGEQVVLGAEVDGLVDAVVDGGQDVVGGGLDIPPGLDGVVDRIVLGIVMGSVVVIVVDEGGLLLLLLPGPVIRRDEAGGSSREQEEGRGPHGSSARTAAQAEMVFLLWSLSIAGSTTNQANGPSRWMDHGETSNTVDCLGRVGRYVGS